MLSVGQFDLYMGCIQSKKAFNHVTTLNLQAIGPDSFTQLYNNNNNFI